MATRYWVGKAASTTEVKKIVYSTATAAATYSVTINGKTITYTASGAPTLTEIVDGLVALFNASLEPEHQELVAAERLDPTFSGLQLTMRDTGVPCTVTAAASSGTAVVSTPTAASGPNFWNVAANWDGGTLPSAADALVVADTSVSILYGLTDTTNYASVDIYGSYTGAIGLPTTNSNGYPEYRTRFLTLGTGSAITINVGYGTGNQPSKVYLDVQGSNATITVLNSTQNTQSGYPIQFRGTAAGSTVRVYGGSAQFDANAGSTAVIATLDVIQQDNGVQPNVDVTSLVTTTTVTAYGSIVSLSGTVTTLVARERAQVTTKKAVGIATVTTSSGAVINWESSGGITSNLIVQALGAINFGRVGTSKTVAATSCFAGGIISDPLGRVTFTGGVVLQACRIGDVRVDRGVGATI